MFPERRETISTHPYKHLIPHTQVKTCCVVLSNNVLRESNTSTHLTVHILLRDAVGPDERGEPTHVCLEHALVHGELQLLFSEDDGVLVVVIEHGAHGRRVAVDVVRIELLLLLQRGGLRGLLERPVGLEQVAGAVGDGLVGGLVVRVPAPLLVLVGLVVVVLAQGAYLLACHDHLSCAMPGSVITELQGWWIKETRATLH